MFSLEDQLEAHPIKSNSELWNFRVKSASVDWDKYITALSKRGAPILLHDSFDVMKMYRKLESDERMKVFVCHDMMGSYLEDR